MGPVGEQLRLDVDLIERRAEQAQTHRQPQPGTNSLTCSSANGLNLTSTQPSAARLPPTCSATRLRLGKAAQNAGGGAVRRPGDGRGAGRTRLAERADFRLRHHFRASPAGAAGGPRAAADAGDRGWDVSPSRHCGPRHDEGASTLVCDFGAPEQEEGGLERNLADHVAKSDAVDHVREPTATTSTSAETPRAGCSATRPPPYRR